jgi:bacterioferritin-associated ferredoxin
MVTTIAFLDESTFRFCPPADVLQITAVAGYDFCVTEEVVEGICKLRCAAWVKASIKDGRISTHRITHLDDIQLITKIMKRCGVCRGEVCSYVAAKRENGIVVAEDSRVSRMLAPHVSGVRTINSACLLKKVA